MPGSRGRAGAAMVALVAGLSALQSARVAPVAAEAPADRRPITVRELFGPGGQPLLGAGSINDRGQILTGMPADDVPDDRIALVVWDRGRVTRVPPEGVGARPADISDRGQVVGVSTGNGVGTRSVPFSWIRGGWSRLAPEGVVGSAVDVNEVGQVLGTRGENGDREVVVWDDEGETTVAPPGHQMWAPRGINDCGQALVNTADGRAVIWQVGGATTLLDGVESGVAINESGEVAGYESAGGPVLWRDGETIEIGTLGGNTTFLGEAFSESGRRALNERGHVVGTSETAAGELHAFLWRDGEMIDLGTLGGSLSAAYAVNDHDQVIGFSQAENGPFHAFLWDDGRMIDLTALAGGTTSTIADINDRGQISGTVDNRPVMWTAPPRRGHHRQ
jgi:probable HAF family extracellular repeat protein